MKVGRINSSQDGIIHDINGEIQCLSSGHGNVPKILINEKEMGNTLRSGYDTNNSGGGGRNSMTKKHSWDVIKQINPSTESGGQQPFQQNIVYSTDGILPALSSQLTTGSHNIQVRSATSSGYEVANEGDSINLSMPNSKTRRGRVGVGVAQTLDTQANQSILLPYLEASSLYNSLDYFFSNFTEIINTKKYGKEIKGNTNQVLQTLLEEIGEVSFTQWGFRILNSFQQEVVLQSKMYEQELQRAIQRECKRISRELSSETDIQEKRDLFGLQKQEKNGDSPQRRKQIKQSIIKSSRSLSELPFENTPQAGEFLFNMLKSVLFKGILYEALSEIYKVWESINVQNKSTQSNYFGNIRRLTPVETERLQGFPDNWTKYGIYEKKVWINKKEKTFKIVEGLQEISRTQRYKMCGNAVTKDIVELIGKKLLKTYE